MLVGVGFGVAVWLGDGVIVTVGTVGAGVGVGGAVGIGPVGWPTVING